MPEEAVIHGTRGVVRGHATAAPGVLREHLTGRWTNAPAAAPDRPLDRGRHPVSRLDRRELREPLLPPRSGISPAEFRRRQTQTTASLTTKPLG
jgi:hypothetical protein